ncbi:MAG: hypothetical protein AABO58_03575 [Acidobacteriota bacterium]
MIAAVATSLLLVVAGWPVAAVLDRRPAPLDRRLAEAYLLGAALASVVLFVHSGWSRASLLVPMLAISAACAWLGREGLGVTRCAVHWIDLATVVLVAGYARFATIGPTAETDFIGIWGVKAKEFWLAGGIDWKFLENPFNQFAHVDYPLLVPLVFDVHAVVAGGWPDRWLGVVNVGLGIATLLLLRAFLAEEARKPLLLALATLACVGVAFAPWIGLAEGALVAFGTAGLLFVRRGDVSRGALYLGLAAMCKNEGLTLIGAAAVAMAIAGNARKIARLWPAAAVVVPWMVVRSIHHLQTDLTTSGVGERAVEHLANLRPMFEAMLRYPVGRPLLWLAIAAAIVIGAREVGGRERFLAAAIALQLLFFVAAYVITPHDVEWHVRWSWERIVDQLAAAATFLALVLVTRRLDRQDPLY